MFRFLRTITTYPDRAWRVLRRTSPDTWVRGLGLTAFMVGIVLRYRYIMVSHNARHYAVSDARNMLEMAAKLLAGAPGQPKDTVWPPGTSAVMAVIERIDPGLQLGAWLQLLQSVAVPVLVAHTVFLGFGASAPSRNYQSSDSTPRPVHSCGEPTIHHTRSAWVALALASLHFGFVHYGGFFLSEQFFQFAFILALWQSVAALNICARQREPQPGVWRDRLGVWLLGGSVGLTWVYAASFRPNAMPVAAFVGTLLAYRAWKNRDRATLGLVASAVVVSVFALAPLADRCSRLDPDGRCLISNNIAMNMVLGQAADVRGVSFSDPAHPELNTGWSPPSLSLHGYKGSLNVPFSIYDEKAALKWLVHQFQQAPGAFLTRAVGNALDLFEPKLWPEMYNPLNSRFALVCGQLFLIGVVGPSVVGWVVLCRRLWQLPPAQLVFAAAPVALVLSAAAAMGEARYRTPADGLFIGLTAALLSGALSPQSVRADTPSRVRSNDRAVPAVDLQSPRWLKGAVVATGAWSLAVLALIVSTSHPLVFALAQAQGARQPVAVQGQLRVQRSAASLSRARKAGSRWDQAGNYVFTCEPKCPELIVDFPQAQRAPYVELSVDANDAYQVAFYAAHKLLGHVDLLQLRRDGLRVDRLRVPKAARHRYDAVGILPLYGDGGYSVGHVRGVDKR